jgi:hypothetical protein
VGDALIRGDSERFVEWARPYAELGVGTIVILPLAEQPVTFIERLGTDVVPASQVSDDPRQLPSSSVQSYTTS